MSKNLNHPTDDSASKKPATTIKGTVLKNPFGYRFMLACDTNKKYDYDSVYILKDDYIVLLDPCNIKYGNKTTFGLCHMSSTVSFQTRGAIDANQLAYDCTKYEVCLKEAQNEFRTTKQVKGRKAFLPRTGEVMWISNIDLRTLKAHGAYLEI